MPNIPFLVTMIILGLVCNGASYCFLKERQIGSQVLCLLLSAIPFVTLSILVAWLLRRGLIGLHREFKDAVRADREKKTIKGDT